MAFWEKLRAVLGMKPQIKEPLRIHSTEQLEKISFGVDELHSNKKFLYDDVSANLQVKASNLEPDCSLHTEAILMTTDDYHLKHFGKADDGLILWMGSQLKYDKKDQDTTDYIFKFLFDTSGELVSSDIQTVGARKVIKPEIFSNRLNALISANAILGPASAMIKTFTVIHEGIEFGLIPRVPEDDEDVWAVEFMPGNTMAFFEPFDSGDYDT